MFYAFKFSQFSTYSAERHVPSIFLISFTHHFLLFMKCHHLSSNQKQGMQFSSAYLSIKFVIYFLFSKLLLHLLTTIKKIYHIFPFFSHILALFQTFFPFLFNLLLLIPLMSINIQNSNCV